MTTSKTPSAPEAVKTEKPSERPCSCREPTAKWCAAHGQPVKGPLYRHWTVHASS